MVYDDGDEETLDLAQERYKVLPARSPAKAGSKAPKSVEERSNGASKKHECSTANKKPAAKASGRLQRGAAKPPQAAAADDGLEDSDADMAPMSEDESAGGDHASDDDFGAGSGGAGVATGDGSSTESESLVEEAESGSGSDSEVSGSDGSALPRRKGAATKRGRPQPAACGAPKPAPKQARKSAASPASAAPGVGGATAAANGTSSATAFTPAARERESVATAPTTGGTGKTPRTGQLLGRLTSATPELAGDAALTPGALTATRTHAYKLATLKIGCNACACLFQTQVTAPLQTATHTAPFSKDRVRLCVYVSVT